MKPSKNESSARVAKDNGCWEQWGGIWEKSVGTDNECLYREGSPRTRRELVFQSYFRDIAGLMQKDLRNSRIVELGAGRGTVAMYASKSGAEVTLVDLSHKGKELAHRNYKAAGVTEPTYIIADATNTNLPESSYDCVFSIGLLEHFEEPKPLLKECLRLLRPGGLFYQVIVPTVPAHRTWLIQILFNPLVTVLKVGRTWARAMSNGKVRDSSDMVRTNFSAKQWIQWMEELGQENVRCLPYNCYCDIYRSDILERTITSRVYRVHAGIKRLLFGKPVLRTVPFMARAQLLYCYKV